jgi:hypothetical protein
MLDDRYLEALGPELAFVGIDDECPEVLIWTGRDAGSGRYAVWAESGEILAASEDPPESPQPQAYLYEAHAAAIRAHCLGTLCDEFDLTPLGSSNGYLTGDQLLESRWLKNYKVLDDLPSDQKKLKAHLESLGAGQVIVKSRANIDTAVLAKSLKGRGSRTVTIAVYRLQKSIKFALVEAI